MLDQQNQDKIQSPNDSRTPLVLAIHLHLSTISISNNLTNKSGGELGKLKEDVECVVRGVVGSGNRDKLKDRRKEGDWKGNGKGQVRLLDHLTRLISGQS